MVKKEQLLVDTSLSQTRIISEVFYLKYKKIETFLSFDGCKTMYLKYSYQNIFQINSLLHSPSENWKKSKKKHQVDLNMLQKKLNNS